MTPTWLWCRWRYAGWGFFAQALGLNILRLCIRELSSSSVLLSATTTAILPTHGDQLQTCLLISRNTRLPTSLSSTDVNNLYLSQIRFEVIPKHTASYIVKPTARIARRQLDSALGRGGETSR